VGQSAFGGTHQEPEESHVLGPNASDDAGFALQDAHAARRAQGDQERHDLSGNGGVGERRAGPRRLETKLPDEFEGQYVLGASGMPLARSESQGALDRLRQVTTLTTKNRQPLEAAGAQVQRENGTVYLFGFAKEGLPISRDGKEVVFTTHMGNLAFTARFNPKDMLYHGELSV